MLANIWPSSSKGVSVWQTFFFFNYLRLNPESLLWTTAPTHFNFYFVTDVKIDCISNMRIECEIPFGKSYSSSKVNWISISNNGQNSGRSTQCQTEGVGGLGGISWSPWRQLCTWQGHCMVLSCSQLVLQF